MATQLSTSAGLGHFLAIELPNNKDQKSPKDEMMNCVYTIEWHNHQRDMHAESIKFNKHIPQTKPNKEVPKMAIPSSPLSSHTKAKITPTQE